MQILTFILGELQTNVYLVYCENTKECLIIDPADDAQFVSDKILQLQLKPIGIVATHGHFDHILAANELQMAFNIPFMIHKDDAFIVKYMNKSAKWWLKHEIIEQPPKIDRELVDGDKIKFGHEELTIIHTPGHTPGSICLVSVIARNGVTKQSGPSCHPKLDSGSVLNPKTKMQNAKTNPKSKNLNENLGFGILNLGLVFTGDTLFANNCVGRTDLPYGSNEDLQKSIKKIKYKFSGFTAYPGHDESFVI